MATGVMVAVLVTWTAFTRTLIPLALDTTVVDVGYVDESGNQLRTLVLADGRTVIVDGGLGDEVELEAQGGQGWAVKPAFAGALGGDYEIDLIGWLVRGESGRVALFSCCCLLVAAMLTRPADGTAGHRRRSRAVRQP